MPKTFVLLLHLFLYVVGHVLSDLIPTWSWSILLLYATCIFFLLYSSYGMALMINIGIWGVLQRSIRIFMAGLIGITLLLWL